jgi:tetratricopeptide (TPR) repeat protein
VSPFLARLGRRFLPFLLCGGATLGLAFADALPGAVSLELGYRRMYSLDFESAQRIFSVWQERQPEDPLGPVSEAASLLFSELDRLGILEAQFFVKDSRFLRRQDLRPDPSIRARFDAALVRAESLARDRLSRNPRDTDALFALALASGLRADYTSLVENRNLAALAPTRQAARWAEELLAVDPGYADAYLATGLGKYIIGSTFAPVRWLLRLSGYAGDKSEGIRELQLAAEGGRYLAPFARLLLAIAYLREGDPSRARGMLEKLHDEFPENPLFAREIARIAAGGD